MTSFKYIDAAPQHHLARELPIQCEIRKLANPQFAQEVLRFFKTGPREYAEGDHFIGVPVPALRKLCKAHASTASFDDVSYLLDSATHEERFMGVCLLTTWFQKSKNASEREHIATFYLNHRHGINNWDLVDCSAYKIAGAYALESEQENILHKLAASPRHWDRRIAMVATFAFIRHGRTDLTFSLASRMLQDEEDLMHKATGWMLREAGKRNLDALYQFLDEHASAMPRTMLRYAIEKFPAPERARIRKLV